MYDSGRFTVKDTVILFITTGIFTDLSGLIVNFINQLAQELNRNTEVKQNRLVLCPCRSKLTRSPR